MIEGPLFSIFNTDISSEPMISQSKPGDLKRGGEGGLVGGGASRDRSRKKVEGVQSRKLHGKNRELHWPALNSSAKETVERSLSNYAILKTHASAIR